MIDPLVASSRIAGSGMGAQSERMRVIAENIANAQSTGQTAGSDPYIRKTITFRTALDRASGTAAVAVRQIGEDKAPFKVEYDPGNPAADQNGNVKMPNVNMLIEMADMREANRSYEANLQMIKQTRAMVSGIIELLRP
ncbi:MULTISPECIES: flagellar basal body rod protein FlgC [unclassified Methylobacterium]|jgi:flagellar basal-body rod protein FlgC|uniref:flagellar basal body rod protein FlgC n=1 Tax=unclassified Methylobacterium TaxID=2615210 RepID=UPI001355D5EF|nr:flagellar basal body rod protein FlgC [Methylobacterium sp. 2A]MWV25106.1 flagellar basal body rod protein FlgC [Methylobacterium sp. 2A]